MDAENVPQDSEKTPQISHYPFTVNPGEYKLTAKQIAELDLSGQEVLLIEKFPGTIAEHFFLDWINGEIPADRERTLDLNTKKLVWELRRAIDRGEEIELKDVSIDFWWKVGGIEWRKSI
jgi:hypothetical protein